MVSVMRRKACLGWHLFSCMGGTKLVVCFDGLKEDGIWHCNYLNKLLSSIDKWNRSAVRSFFLNAQFSEACFFLTKSHLILSTAIYSYYSINAIQWSVAFDRSNSDFLKIFSEIQLFFFPHDNCSLGNSHFSQVVHFQEKLLRVELWVSLLSPPKSYDWSTRKKGPIRDHLAKMLSIAFTLLLFGLLLTSAESKDRFSDNQERGRCHAALSSSIVRAQVPVSANHFNQLNATDTACCYEPPVQFKEAHRWAMLWKLFCRPLLPTSAMGVRDRGTRKMGVTGQANITQTTCLHSHAGSSLPSFHIHVFTRATQHIWYEMWVMDLCLVQRFKPLYS